MLKAETHLAVGQEEVLELVLVHNVWQVAHVDGLDLQACTQHGEEGVDKAPRMCKG